MCRLLGIVASESTDFRIVLREVPRSLAALALEHPDGWGIAVHDDARWKIEKGVACATDDEAFHRHAHGSRGTVLVSHIRKKTVGPTSPSNTHPFEHDGWVFAHNGTIKDVAWVRANASADRLAQIAGDTDSELFFAMVLTRLDRRGERDVDDVVAELVDEARGREGFGAFNFLLSNGEVVYAHRCGRSLYMLDRGPHDVVRVRRASDESGAVVETPWSQRRRAVFIASEKMTEEPWEEIAEGTLVRVDRRPEPRWRALRRL